MAFHIAKMIYPTVYYSKDPAYGIVIITSIGLAIISNTGDRIWLVDGQLHSRFFANYHFLKDK